MIKVGQIYKMSNNTHFIITSINDCYIFYLSKSVKEKLSTSRIGEWYMERQLSQGKYKLIAEYPTWQEAVNSKEFNE